MGGRMGSQIKQLKEGQLLANVNIADDLEDLKLDSDDV